MSARVPPVRAFLQRYVMALVLSFVLTIGSISAAFWLANDTFDSVRTARIDDNVLNETDKGEPANFLIIGSDTRSFVDSSVDEQHFGDAQAQSGQRSDTIMVAHVDPRTRTGIVVSFPRDLWVDIPQTGKSRINAAFNIGPQRVIETIEAELRRRRSTTTSRSTLRAFATS